MKFNPFQVGIYTGAFLGVIHSLWAILVFFGLARPFLDFIYGLHFLTNPFVIKPFSLTNAVMLVVFVFVVGYILGYVGTVCWNKMQKGK